MKRPLLCLCLIGSLLPGGCANSRGIASFAENSASVLRENSLADRWRHAGAHLAAEYPDPGIASQVEFPERDEANRLEAIARATLAVYMDSIADRALDRQPAAENRAEALTSSLNQLPGAIERLDQNSGAAIRGVLSVLSLPGSTLRQLALGRMISERDADVQNVVAFLSAHAENVRGDFATEAERVNAWLAQQFSAVDTAGLRVLAAQHRVQVHKRYADLGQAVIRYQEALLLIGKRHHELATRGADSKEALASLAAVGAIRRATR
jgi:hypothetical protein